MIHIASLSDFSGLLICNASTPRWGGVILPYCLPACGMARSSTDLRLRLRLDHRHVGIVRPRGSNVRCLCELAGVNMACQCRNSIKTHSKRQRQNIKDQEPIFGIVYCLNKPGTGAVKRRACATPATKTVHIIGRKQML